jgi:hypothetical protein
MSWCPLQRGAIAGLLRRFLRKTWIEAGATQDGKVEAMLRFNF